ncbi:unnamed protein product [Blepharisma stoltei]|uniref:GOLD domain-containing protein n=1 Tax=Blepharisma stoltei TaxID=1481888 RepID=A0AAU9JC46_9CILI|nr:unnamed protein product [Blepharisma stoltei]
MLILIPFLIISCHASFFTLPPRVETCFQLTTAKGSDIWGAYVISGEGDTKVITRVHKPDGIIIWQNPRDTREGSFDFVSENGGKYKLCFRTMDSLAKTVSFEFNSQDKTQFKELPKEEEIGPINDGLTKMNKELDKIYRNIHFYQRREKVHRDLAERTCDRVLWTVLIKIAVLVLISFSQIYMLRKFLEPKGSRI